MVGGLVENSASRYTYQPMQVHLFRFIFSWLILVHINWQEEEKQKADKEAKRKAKKGDDEGVPMQRPAAKKPNKSKEPTEPKTPKKPKGSKEPKKPKGGGKGQRPEDTQGKCT